MRKRIKEARIALGLNQQQFGKQIGLTKAAISLIEKENGNNPSERTVILICQQFNINRDWLQTGNGQMFLEPSSEDEKVEQLLLGNNQFAKLLLHTIAKLNDDELIALERFFNLMNEEYKKTGD